MHRRALPTPSATRSTVAAIAPPWECRGSLTVFTTDDRLLTGRSSTRQTPRPGRTPVAFLEEAGPMASAVIVDAVRTAGGKRNGKLSGWDPADLGGEEMRALVEG